MLMIISGKEWETMCLAFPTNYTALLYYNILLYSNIYIATAVTAE